MSALLADAVARYAEAVGTSVAEAEDELTTVLSELAEAASAGAIPAADATALRRVDTPVVTSNLAVADARLGADAAWSRLRATAVAIDEAAERLGVTASAVRRVIGERPGPGVELLGTKDRRGR